MKNGQDLKLVLPGDVAFGETFPDNLLGTLRFPKTVASFIRTWNFPGDFGPESGLLALGVLLEKLV